VLRAIGVPEPLAHAALRFGIGRFNTVEEIDYAGGRVIEEVRRLRDISPLYKSKRAKVNSETGYKSGEKETIHGHGR